MMMNPRQWWMCIGVGLVSLWLTSCETQPRFVLERKMLGCPDLSCESASWSPQADQLVISANTGRKVGLWIAQSDLGDDQQLYAYLNQDLETAVEGATFAALLHRYFQGDYKDPVWSPTGEEIAFTLSGRTETPGIYRVNLHSGIVTLTLATAPPLEAYAPHDVNLMSWSNDGQHLLYTEYTAPRTFAINRLTPTSGQTETLQITSWPWAALSPDGQQLAYITNTTAPDVALLSLDTGAIRQLTNDGATIQEKDLAWSPDGRFLLIIAEAPGEKDEQHYLVLLQVADGQQQIVESEHHYESLAWSADGQWVILTEQTEGGWKLSRLKVNPEFAP